jgi:hypothetical protein
VTSNNVKVEVATFIVELTLLCGVEVWVRIGCERRIQAEEIKCFVAVREGTMNSARTSSAIKYIWYVGGKEKKVMLEVKYE